MLKNDTLENGLSRKGVYESAPPSLPGQVLRLVLRLSEYFRNLLDSIFSSKWKGTLLKLIFSSKVHF